MKNTTPKHIAWLLIAAIALLVASAIAERKRNEAQEAQKYASH